MANDLPKVKIDGRLYYQDDRLQEFRQVTAPVNRIPFDEIGSRKIEPVTTNKSFSKTRKLK